MYHRSLHRMHRNLTRGQFERLLGGRFRPGEGEPRLRINHRWETWTGWRQAEGRRMRFARSLATGKTTSARTWSGLARKLRLRRAGRVL